MEGLAATQEDLLGVPIGDRSASISLDADDEALTSELVPRVSELSARGARRLVIAVGADDEARIKRLLLKAVRAAPARGGSAGVLLGTGRRLQ